MLHLKNVLFSAALLLVIRKVASASLESQTPAERLKSTMEKLARYCAFAYKPKSRFFTRETDGWQDFNKRILERLFCGSPDGKYDWVKGEDPCACLKDDSQKLLVYEVYRATSERGTNGLTSTLYDVCQNRSQAWNVSVAILKVLDSNWSEHLAKELHEDALQNPGFIFITDDTNMEVLKPHIFHLKTHYITPMSFLLKDFFPRNHLNTYFAKLDSIPNDTVTIYEDVLGRKEFEQLKTAWGTGKCKELVAKHEKSWTKLQTILNAEWFITSDYDASDMVIVAFEESIRRLYEKCVKQPEGVEKKPDVGVNDAVKQVVMKGAKKVDNENFGGPTKDPTSSPSTKREATTIMSRRGTLIAISLLIVGVLLMVAAAVSHALVGTQSMESLIE